MSLRKPKIYLFAVACLALPLTAFAAAPVAPGAPVSGKDLLVEPVPVPKEGKADAAQKSETVPATAAVNKPSGETAKPTGKAAVTGDKGGASGSVSAASAATTGASSIPAAGQAQKMEQAGASAPGASAPASPSVSSSLPSEQTVPVWVVLDRLRGQLEEKKLRVAIEEQDSKLRQFRNPPLPPVPAAPAPASLDMLLNQPSAKLPALPKMGGVSTTTSRGTYVESIQGVNGKLSATVRSNGKAVTLRPGDSFSGGVVESIQYNQVTIRRGKAKSVLPFSE